MTKEKWRKIMKEKLSRISEEQYKEKCTIIYRALFSEHVWQAAGTIGITLSVGREVGTRKIIEQAWKLNKRVAVPKCEPNTSMLTFYEITSFSELEPGYAGIMEPHPKEERLVEKQSIDLLFVPGLVFDSIGYRIGYGGGYYDRFLAEYPNETLALAMHFQFVEDVPHDHYDLPVHRLITDQAVIHFNHSVHEREE